MFCPKCGERNSADAKFCAQCGCKLDEQVQTAQTATKHSTQEVKKQILDKFGDSSMKGKQIIGVLSVILIISIVMFYKNGTAYDTPKKALEKYQEYSGARKYGKLYDLFDIEESDFVNKKTFVKACEEHNVSTEFMMMDDMKKSDHKRYFFFDQYQLDCMPSGVRAREIYVPYVKGATLEVNGKKIGEDCLNKNKTEYVVRAFVTDDLTFTYKNTGGLIKEKTYGIGDVSEAGSYWVNIEYTDKEKEKAKETLTKTLQALTDYVGTTSGSYKDIEKYFATEKDAQYFWKYGFHGEENKKLSKSAQITEGISINDPEDENSMRLIDAIPFDVTCKYEYEIQTASPIWKDTTYKDSGDLSFNNDTLLMRKVGNEWKLDVTSYCWRF